MPRYEEAGTVIDVDASDDASYVPKEVAADSDDEKSDSQLVEEGIITLDSQDTDFFIAPDSASNVEVTEGPDDEPPPAEKKVESTEEPKVETEDKKVETPPEKKISKAQARINEITREKYDAIRAKERLEKEVAELRSKVQESSKATELATLESQKPKYDDFENEADYHEQLGRWGARMEIQSVKPKSEPQAEVAKPVEEDPRDRVINLGEQMYPDFMELVSKIPISQAMFEAAQDSEKAVEILYHLAGRPEDASRISSIKSAVSVAREIGRIEALFDEVVPEVVVHTPDQDNEILERNTKLSISKAPTPIKPVGSGGKAGKKSLDDMGLAEYYESRGYTRDGVKKSRLGMHIA